MFNGSIDKFPEIRRAIATKIDAGYLGMVEGSSDTEHMAALYMTNLCPPAKGQKASDAADQGRSANEMKVAMENSIKTVQSIQIELGIQEPDNWYNTCATDGSSMFGLCYRTKGEPLTLWLSVGAADHLNRKTCYLTHGTIDKPKGPQVNIHQSPDILKRGADDKVIGINDDILKKVREEEQSPAGHGPHVIIASEPTTLESGWYKLYNHEIIMVDTVIQGDVETIALAGAVIDA